MAPPYSLQPAAFFQYFLELSVRHLPSKSTGLKSGNTPVSESSLAPDASAVMLTAAVTAGVTSSAVRVPPAEMLTAAVKALRRMPAASHVEAA